MNNMPGNSKEYDIHMKRLKVQLDAIYVQEYKVVLSLDQTLDVSFALKLASEFRAQKPVLSIYPLHKMKTAADANDGTQKDEGMTLVGNVFRKKPTTM